MLLDGLDNLWLLVVYLLPELLSFGVGEAHPELGDVHVNRVVVIIDAAKEEVLSLLIEFVDVVVVLHVDGLFEEVRQDLSQR